MSWNTRDAHRMHELLRDLLPADPTEAATTDRTVPGAAGPAQAAADMLKHFHTTLCTPQPPPPAAAANHPERLHIPRGNEAASLWYRFDAEELLPSLFPMCTRSASIPRPCKGGLGPVPAAERRHVAGTHGSPRA